MIVLQFVSTDTIGSEIVSLYEGGPGFSHVDAVLPDGLLGARANQIGSVPGGVQLRPPDYEPFTQRLVVELPSCGEIESKWETFLRLQIGKPYDLRAILGFALPGDWHERGAFICSALQGAALSHCGVFQPRLVKPWFTVDPNALLLCLSAMFPIPALRSNA